MVLGLATLTLGPVLAFSAVSATQTPVAKSAPASAAAHAVARIQAPVGSHLVTDLREPQTEAPATPAPTAVPQRIRVKIPTQPPAPDPTAAAKKAAAVPAVAGPPASPNSVTGIIEAAAARWGVSGSWMVKIGRCESGLNPHAVNPSGPYDGLFQFLQSTFRANGGTNIWDAADQSNIAAKMLAHGQAHQWSCA